HDISVGGIGAELKMASALELQQGIFIPRCDIVLPNFDGKISSSLEVRFFAKDKKSANIRIGGRFVDLDRSQQHIIERFVAYLDRRLRRKMIK
ncbi:MAG TPA: PilZ domain-containing protein, partial [Burkholderiales bacterium]|nr:PilZ domain-containing protein [Burkholderiales bacterium]